MLAEVRTEHSCVPNQVSTFGRTALIDLRAEYVSVEEVFAALKDASFCRNDHMALETAMSVLRNLLDNPGGAAVVVCSTDFARHLKRTELDKGAMQACFEAYSPNLHRKPTQFQVLLRAFRVHTDTDSWEPWVIEDVVTELARLGYRGDVPAVIQQLKDQSKDGSVVVSLHGDVLGASERLMHSDDCPFRLVKANGRGTGTRHIAGLGVAHRMSLYPNSGAVFVASDSGRLSIMIPGTDRPAVYEVQP